MLKNVISQGEFHIWPQISLVLFVLTFVCIMAWIFRRGSKEHYHTMANMISDDPMSKTSTEHIYE